MLLHLLNLKVTDIYLFNCSYFVRGGGKKRIQAFNAFIATGSNGEAVEASMRIRRIKIEEETDAGEYVLLDMIGYFPFSLQYINVFVCEDCRN